jgi:hypothetical protein
MVQKSKSVAQIFRNREVVAEVRHVRDGFKLIQNGQSLGVFDSQQAAWDHFVQPIREHNREVEKHNQRVRAQHEAKMRELDRQMANSSNPHEREMARLMGKLDALNSALEGK